MNRPIDPLDPLAGLLAPDAPATSRAPSREIATPPLKAPDPDSVFEDGGSVFEEAAPVDLGDEDRELLVALAAFQLRYGEAAEALAYLMAARAIFPKDPDVLRLTADALLAVGRTDEAEAVLSELGAGARRRSPVLTLSMALVRLAQGRGGEARKLYRQYREAVAPDAFEEDLDR